MDDFIRRLQEQQEMMQRLVEGPLQYISENEAAIAQIRQLAHGIDVSALHGSIAALEASDLASHLPALADSTAATIATLAMPESISMMDHYVSERRHVHEAVERLAFPQEEWAAQIDTMASYFEATRVALPTIDFDRIGELVAAAETERALVARLTDELVFRHADLINSLGQAEGLLASLPPSVSDLPTLDLFVHAGAVRSITPHEPLEDENDEGAAPLRITVVTETELYLEEALPALKPAFLTQYRGVKARTADRGPDGWTQGSASMRKLLKGVLHTTAPNELVLPWAVRNNKSLDDHGRPTRATKVEWLCQFTSNEAYRKYVQTELTSALALIGLIDTAQHVDEFPEFENQYDWIMLRAEVALRHMLALWKVTS